MSWVRLTQIGHGKSATDVRVELTRRTATSRAIFIIAIRQKRLDQIGGGAWDMFFGEGEHAGKLRIEAGVLLVGNVHRSRRIFRLGHLPRFPDRRERSQACEVVEVSGGLEVTLPSWAQPGRGAPRISKERVAEIEAIADDKIDTTDIPEVGEEFFDKARQSPVIVPRHDPPAPSPKPQPPVPTPKLTLSPRPSTAAAASVAGVSVDLAVPSIRFGEKTVGVTTRAARLVLILAAAKPAYVDRRHVIGKLWKNEKVPSAADEMLTQYCRDLERPLREIGLKLTQTKGVGIALGEAT